VVVVVDSTQMVVAVLTLEGLIALGERVEKGFSMEG
jgi:hypothetical protein